MAITKVWSWGNERMVKEAAERIGFLECQDQNHHKAVLTLLPDVTWKIFEEGEIYVSAASLHK